MDVQFRSGRAVVLDCEFCRWNKMGRRRRHGQWPARTDLLFNRRRHQLESSTGSNHQLGRIMLLGGWQEHVCVNRKRRSIDRSQRHLSFNEFRRELDSPLGADALVYGYRRISRCRTTGRTRCQNYLHRATDSTSNAQHSFDKRQRQCFVDHAIDKFCSPAELRPRIGKLDGGLRRAII